MGVRLTWLNVNTGAAARATGLLSCMLLLNIGCAWQKKKEDPLCFSEQPRVMSSLDHCEVPPGQYGHKLEGDLNHIQSRHKSVTLNNLLARYVLLC